MAEIKLDPQKIGLAVAVIVAAFVVLGVWGKVSSLESRVVELNVAIAELADVQAELEAVSLEMAHVRADVRSIAMARDDILIEICAILDRPPAQCGVGA